MRSYKLSASMMCADLKEINETISILEQENIDYLHIDVMDGAFVPNFGLGADYIRGLREITKLPLDLHLMIRSPEFKLQWIGIREGDIVSIHYESTDQVQRTLDMLEKYRCKRFIALNPATPVNVLEDVFDSIDGINLLMVNPGHAGQNMVPGMVKKAERLVAYLRKQDKEELFLEVDGNITPHNGRILREIGADTFVVGSSSIFSGKPEQLRKNICQFRAELEHKCTCTPVYNS